MTLEFLLHVTLVASRPAYIQCGTSSAATLHDLPNSLGRRFQCFNELQVQAIHRQCPSAIGLSSEKPGS